MRHGKYTKAGKSASENPRRGTGKEAQGIFWTGKGVLQGIVNADEKDENEVTGRLGRMLSTCEKCRKICSRSDDDKGEGIVCVTVCCQCTGREENCAGIQECKMCLQRILGN